MNWGEFKRTVPEIARLGEERFEQTGLALIGTVRRDGSPRVSPVEPYLADDHLLLGMMARSKKAVDLLRDPRCVVHSVVSDRNGSEGEFKLRGRAVLVEDPELLESYCRAYAARQGGRPPAGFPAHLFSLDIGSAAFIGWDIAMSEMLVKRWTPRHGLRETRRKYP